MVVSRALLPRRFFFAYVGRSVAITFELCPAGRQTDKHRSAISEFKTRHAVLMYRNVRNEVNGRANPGRALAELNN